VGYTRAGGMDLIDEKSGEVQAVLAATSRNDRVLKRYVSESSSWTTVTPMLLPGQDDPGGIRKKLRAMKGGEGQKALLERLMKRREALVRKALRHAGLGDELAFSAEIEMRETVTWPVKVAGPLCIGRGRFSGLGLFATVTA
jgi:CRISPR-associated protein Csb2